MSKVLGIDVGGTGIKGAIVDTATSELISERIKYKTPTGALPEGISKTAKKIANDLSWPENGQIGMGFPSIIRNGIICSASNISDEWIGIPIDQHFRDVFNRDNVVCINDADAAGVAEMNFGKGVGLKGTIILLTIGTGIGSALFKDGILIPNTEFGHLNFKGDISERYASNNTRKILDLSWEEWGSRLNEFLEHIEFVFSPDAMILGGGVSKSLEYYKHLIKTNCPVISAKLENNAGIIGAAKTAQSAFPS